MAIKALTGFLLLFFCARFFGKLSFKRSYPFKSIFCSVIKVTGSTECFNGFFKLTKASLRDTKNKIGVAFSLLKLALVDSLTSLEK